MYNNVFLSKEIKDQNKENGHLFSQYGPNRRKEKPSL